MLIYLAAPIDQATYQARGLHGLVLTRLMEAGHTIFDPHGAWRTTSRSDALQQGNEAIIDLCDAVVALLPKGVITVGVPMEIQYACDIGKKVVVWTDYDTSPLALTGKPITLIKSLYDIIPALQAQKPKVIMFDEPIAKHVGGNWDRPYQDDAGYDLAISTGGVSTNIYPRGHHVFPTGVSVQWPLGMFGLILPRSSTIARGLLVSPTVIDPGWRGELYVHVVNVSEKKVVIEDGDRLAQIVPLTNRAVGLQFQAVEALDPSDRGTNGFGSSGR